VEQTVTIGEQKVCPESESLKLSATPTPTPQVENPSDSSTPTPQPCYECSYISETVYLTNRLGLLLETTLLP